MIDSKVCRNKAEMKRELLVRTQNSKPYVIKPIFGCLAKGKFIDRRFFESLDTSGWISAAMSKKTEIWQVNTTYSMFFGKKGRGLIPMLRHSCEVYKDNLEKIGVKVNDLLDGEYYSLLKAPFALLYMPMLKYYGYYDDNFIN